MPTNPAKYTADASAAPLGGTEVIPCAIGGVDKKCTVDDIRTRVFAAKATAAQAKAATAEDAMATPKSLADYAAPQTLTDAATVAYDVSLGVEAKVTLAGNRTLGSPSNLKSGQSGHITITQDATGNRTLAYHADWKFPGGTAPTLTTTAAAIDLLGWRYDGTTLFASLNHDFK